MAQPPAGGSAQFCGKCGTRLTANAKFCGSCGAPVQASAESAGKPPARATARRSGGSRSLWLVIGVAVVLVGLLAAVVLLTREPAPAASTIALPAAPVQEAIPNPEVARISPADALASASAGRAVIVDVRDRASYDQGHVAGAISLPLNELPARYQELPRDRSVLTYCT